MTAAGFLAFAETVTLVVLSVSLLLVTLRIIVGPTLPDRIVALDLLVGVVIGFIAAIVLRTGQYTYLDIALALGLVGFLATVALAQFVLRQGRAGDAEATLPDTDTEPDSKRSEKT